MSASTRPHPGQLVQPSPAGFSAASPPAGEVGSSPARVTTTIRRLLRWPFCRLASFFFVVSGRLYRVAQWLHYVPLAGTTPSPAAPATALSPPTSATPQADLAHQLVAEMRLRRALQGMSPPTPEGPAN